MEHSGDEQSVAMETDSCTEVGESFESPELLAQLTDDSESESREPEPSQPLPPPSPRKTYPARNRKPPDYLSKTS